MVHDIPFAGLLAGGNDFGLNHGEYRHYGAGVPMSNLFVTMLQALGIERESFVDSTGPLEGMA